MDTQSTIQVAINEIRVGAPRGVTITTDPNALPTVPLNPVARTPVFRSTDGKLQLMLLAQSTTKDKDAILSVPDVLGINGETQIGLSRANRVMPTSQTTIPHAVKSDRCTVCEAVPQKLSHQGNRPAFEVDNIRPFGPLLHKVVSSQKHIVSLKDLGLNEVQDATEQFFTIAEQGRTQFGPALDGLTIGMNFGEYARSGASQIHFHYQVTGLGTANFNAADRLGALCQAYQQMHAGADYLSDYCQALVQADLVVAENSLAFAYVPISPRFKGEVQIMLKQGKAGNLLEMPKAERDALGELQHKMMGRYFRLGCQALNQVWYMSRFSAKNDWGQRLIISMYPRTSIIAFYELSGNNVIDTLPWKAGATLKAAEHLHFSL